MRMKLQSNSIHIITVSIALALVGGASAGAATNVLSGDMTTTLQDMQEKLDLQNQRIERIYTVIEPFLDELEREGQQLEQQRSREEAERDLEQPVSVMVHEGNYEQALEALDQGLKKKQAEAMHLHYRLFNLSGCFADWDRCLDVGRTLLACPSFQHDVTDLRNYAVAALLAGDRKTYDDVCTQVITEYGETDDPVVADRAAKLLMLTPEISPEQMDLALHWVDIVLEDEDNREYPWYQLVKGISEYRRTEPDATLQWLAVLSTNDDPRIASLAGYFSAMAQDILNQPELANEALILANTNFNSILELGNLGVAGEKWWYDAAAAILIRAEAEQMILGEEISPRPTMESLTDARRRNVPKKPESPETLVGQPVPGTFKLSLLDGGEFILPDEQNENILLLDFWATWCGPCRSMMPVLARISKDYADRGVRYVAVNLRETPDVIRNYLASENLEIIVALDTDATMANAFLVRGIPTMVVIDPKNIIRKVHVGSSPSADEELRAILDELLDEQPPEQ